METPQKKKPKMILFLYENSLFLVFGALIAFTWANLSPDVYKDGELVQQGSYTKFVHYSPFNNDHDDHHKANGHEPAHDDNADHGEAVAHSSHFNLHFLVNDLLMALFFAIAAKEVFESLLPGGALSNARKAASPLLATLGGIIGPAGVYVAGSYIFDPSGEMNLARGWAIPCATDIAFSYLTARLIFGGGHPAIAFLLLLAIADDAVGLMILAIFYPNPAVSLNLWWMLLAVAACGLCYLFQKARLHSFWWYLAIPGAMCWFAFFKSGIHPALGLVPIIVCMPHAHTDLGIFARDELGRHDTLNEFEHWWDHPVELILGIFALVNAGVVVSNFGLGTWLVLAGLLCGKPLGIFLFTWLGEKLFGFEIPTGMSYRHIFVLGIIAGLGFTVALFVSDAAFPLGSGIPIAIRDSVKMGALLSFFAMVVAFIVARMLGIKPDNPASETESAS